MPKRKRREYLPAVGTVLTKSFRGSTINATVLAVNPSTGKVSLKIGAETYPSLSAAAKALTGNETNGWAFWGLDQR